MNRRAESLKALSCGVFALGTLGLAIAPAESQELERAVVDRIAPATADVTLRPSQDLPRPATVDDELVPLDELLTGANSLAQLVFAPGGSLIRLGQNSLFRFVPEGREFVLDNGSVMLVTPPGRGGGRLVTPAAVAAVQGSLVVATARTNNGSEEARFLNFTSTVELENPDTGNVIGRLDPGQAALAIDGELVTIIDFDIEAAIETVAIMERLEVDEADSPEAQAALRQEKNFVDGILSAETPDEVLGEALNEGETVVEEQLQDSVEGDDSGSFRDIPIVIQ
ncbi:MAG: hypothetical protein AAFX40_01695 [Cyanobacteria bacterium J06639_1]